MIHTSIPIATGKAIYLLAGRTDTGQVGGGDEVCLPLQAQHSGESAGLRGSARAIGDLDKAGCKRCQTSDAVPEPLLHCLTSRRNKLEGQDWDWSFEITQQQSVDALSRQPVAQPVCHVSNQVLIASDFSLKVSGERLKAHCSP